MSGSGRVLLIGLDAAEPRLIEEWIADGSLPVLAALKQRGAYGRLRSSAEWLAGSPWPTFYTGRSPGDHGFYHHLGWSPDRMNAERPSPRTIPLVPFWYGFGPAGPRTVAIDVPMTYHPEPFNGVALSGFASHDGLVPPGAFPADILDWVTREIGPAPATNEEYVPLPVQRLLEIRDEQHHGTRLVADLATALLRREPSDLFVVAFGATHRGGHKLWDATGVKGEPSPAERAALADALRRIYMECDAAVGRIIDAAGDTALTLVFSLHGMGANTSRVEVLPEMVRRTLEGPPADRAPRTGLLHGLRELVPNEWRHAVKSRLPVFVQDRLTAFWRTGGYDWPRTRAFCPLADLQGYVRINLVGREAKGVVQPGSEYEALCGQIADGLQTFVDADTGERVAFDIGRPGTIFPGGERVAGLPDLIVPWATSPTADQRALVSPTLGTIEMPSPGTNPTGRSGNHRPEGFLIAIGSGFAPGAVVEGGHILDLAPTVHAALGVATPGDMRGRDLRCDGPHAGPAGRDDAHA
jgi:predicted AlkP superfamily phosphohydrolase/phosphomutase